MRARHAGGIAVLLLVAAFGVMRPSGAERQERPAPARGTAVLSGLVTSETGVPIPRATVSLSSPDAPPRVTSSDANGQYQFTGLVGGRYTITASKPGHVALRFGTTDPVSAGEAVVLADGGRFTRGNIRLPRAGVISGRIVDEFGQPVLDARVQAMRLQYSAGRRRLVPASRVRLTDDLGQFRLFGLLPGMYYVSADVRSTTGFESSPTEATGFPPTFYPGTSDPDLAQQVTVGAGDEIPNIDLWLQPARLVRLSGIANDSQRGAFATGRVRLVRQDATLATGNPPESRVSGDGRFAFPNVAPGAYMLYLWGVVGRVSEFGSLPIAVGADDIEGIALASTRGVSAHGRIVWQGAAIRAAATQVQVSARPIDPEIAALVGFVPPVRAGTDGTFELTSLFGRRMIRVAVLPLPWSLKAVTLGGQDVTDTGIDFDVVGASVTGLEIVLTDRPTIVAGNVARRDRSPAAGTTVLVFSSDRSRWTPHSRFVQMVRTDQRGQFEVRGLPGGAYLAVAVDLQGPEAWNDPEVLDRLRPQATSFGISNGETRTLSLVMAR